MEYSVCYIRFSTSAWNENLGIEPRADLRTAISTLVLVVVCTPPLPCQCLTLGSLHGLLGLITYLSYSCNYLYGNNLCIPLPTFAAQTTNKTHQKMPHVQPHVQIYLTPHLMSFPSSYIYLPP